MAGFPKDVAWARRQVEAAGRPLRGLVLELLGGEPLSVAEQKAVLGGVLREGEHLRVFGSEVWVQGDGVPSGEGCGESLVVLRQRERARRALERHRAVEGRAQWQAGYHEAMQDASLRAMEVQERLLAEGLEPGAEVAVKRLAAAVARDVLDRVGGKAVQAVETTHNVGEGWREVLRAPRRPRSVMEGREVLPELESGEGEADDA